MGTFIFILALAGSLYLVGNSLWTIISVLTSTLPGAIFTITFLVFLKIFWG
mgnify:CR=1 FL=1